MASLENIEPSDTLDYTEDFTTDNDNFRKKQIMTTSEEMFGKTMKDKDGEKLEPEDKSPKDNSNLQKLITNVKKFKLFLTNKHVFKAGFFVLSALFFGYSASRRWKLLNTFQDSIQVTSYAANCMFYPINPFMYSNLW